MSVIHDGYGYASRATVTVHTDTASAKVTYPNPNGGKPFRVMFHQKPNPIGFHARLPGDAPQQTQGWYQPTAGQGKGPPPMPRKP